MSAQITTTGLLAAVTNLQNILKALPNLKADSEAAAIAAAKTAAKQQTKESLEAAGISGPIASKPPVKPLNCKPGTRLDPKTGNCRVLGPTAGGGKKARKTRKARKIRKRTHRNF